MKFASLPLNLAGRLMFAFGFGFFLSMFTRSVSNIVKQPIQAELMLSEEAISLALGTSFFVAFGLAQLPLGVLLDRYDPRKVNALLFLLAAAGAVIMGMSQDAAMLSFGRILMGAGFAAGMMASLKTYALWFPQNRLPTINGLQFMIGVLGALSATKPTEMLLSAGFDWRELYFLFAGLTVVAAVVMVVVAPRHESDEEGETLADQIQGVVSVYTDAYFWRVAPWMFISVGVSQGLGTLYVFSWLTDVAAYTVGTAASAVMVISGVSAINFALLGPLQEKLAGRGFGVMLLPILGQSAAMVMLGLLAVQVKAGVVPIWMFWTMTVGTTTLIFAALTKAFPPHLMGRVYTAFNLLGFLSTAVAQWLIGLVLDQFPRTPAGGAAPEGYRWGFALMLAFQLCAALWFVLAARFGFGAKTMLEKAAEIQSRDTNHDR